LKACCDVPGGYVQGARYEIAESKKTRHPRICPFMQNLQLKIIQYPR
jgi:hypothetical protein